MTDTSPEHAPATPVARCPGCDYDLRGLPPLSRTRPCPECGYPANLYAPPQSWLRHADARWLRKVHLGLRLQQWSCSALIVVLIGSIALAFLAMFCGLAADLTGNAVFDRIDPALTYFFWIPAAAGIAGILTHVGGAWLTCASTPEVRRVRARRCARCCGILFAPLCCLSFVPIASPWPAAPAWAYSVRPTAAIVISTGFLFALSSWCKRLEFHSERWSPAAPRRYRRVGRSIAVAAIVAAIFDLAMQFGPVASTLASPPTGASRDPFVETWPPWFLLAFVAAVQGAVAPARRAIGHELRGRALPSGLGSSEHLSPATTTPAMNGGRVE